MPFAQSVHPFAVVALEGFPFVQLELGVADADVAAEGIEAEVLCAVTALPQSTLEKAESLEQLRWLENGYRIGVGITDVETIGIDTPQDLARAEEFLSHHPEFIK